jgi:DNA-binding MarR family transcriptional regulator
MTDTVSQQLNMLNQIYKESEDVYHSFSVKCGLADSSLWLLYSLYEEQQPLTQADICTQWSVSKQTLNSAIKKMQDGGSIELENSGQNRKTKQIVLTPSGIELAERTAGRMAAAERQALCDLSEDERAALVSLSKKHLDFLKRELGNL